MERASAHPAVAGRAASPFCFDPHTRRRRFSQVCWNTTREKARRAYFRRSWESVKRQGIKEIGKGRKQTC